MGKNKIVEETKTYYEVYTSGIINEEFRKQLRRVADRIARKIMEEYKVEQIIRKEAGLEDDIIIITTVLKKKEEK